MLHGRTPCDCVYECIVFDLQFLTRINDTCSKSIHDIIEQKIPINIWVSEHFPSLGTIIKEQLYKASHPDILADLSQVESVNSNYFCRYFRDMTDRTPIDYLNYYRIECACEMLSTRNVSIRDVAISCGYNSENYFIKTFRKHNGVMPKQFMKYRI